MAIGDTPIPGTYKMQLVKGGPWVPVRIWRGFPVDPDTGETREAGGYIWRARINGYDVDIWRAWPFCGKQPIDQAEYRYLLDLNAWAQRYAPDSPEANPRRPVKLEEQRPLF